MHPVVTTGTLVNGRYRAVRIAWPSAVGPVWQARDGVLDRDVLLFTLAPEAAVVAEARDALVAAATRAAALSDPSIAQVYDCSTDPPYLVSEMPAGGRLAERIADKALPLRDAARVVVGVGRALHSLHERGVAHGMVSPAWVGIDEEGRGKLLGTGMADVVAIAAAVRGASPDPRPIPSGYPAPGVDPIRGDVRMLAALAFHMLAGRPPGPGASLAKAKLPPAVADALERGIAGEATLRELVDAFASRAAPPVAAEPEASFLRTEGRWLAGMVLAIGVAVAIAIASLAFVRTQNGKRSTSPPTPHTKVTALKIVAAHDFDPPPGNGSEHPDQVDEAFDGNPTTSWSTVGYSTADFGGGKSGVGLVFDLGSATGVGRIQVLAAQYSGWQAEWRTAAAFDAGSTLQDFTPVSGSSFTATTAHPAVVTPASHPSARYWLLWITRLTDTSLGGPYPYAAAVAEVQFFS